MKEESVCMMKTGVGGPQSLEMILKKNEENIQKNWYSMLNTLYESYLQISRTLVP